LVCAIETVRTPKVRNMAGNELFRTCNEESTRLNRRLSFLLLGSIGALLLTLAIYYNHFEQILADI